MPDHTPLQLGWDMTEPRSALTSFLSSLPAPPRLLALGEPTHSLDAFPTWCNRIFRTLVEEHGFRSIAIESDIIAGLRVNAHVTSGQDTLDEVMRTGFSHGFGARPANRELVEWMRAFNAARAPEGYLRFYGFDAPLEFWAASPRDSLLALHTFLATHLGEVPVDRATLEHLCGEEVRWTNPATVMDAAQSIGNSDEARQLRLLADDLSTLLRTETPRLAAQAGFWEAGLHARTATGLLQYHALMANPAPTRLAQMSALRDLLMADSLSAIAGREQARGPTLVFAHNSHLQRQISAMNMAGLRLEWWSAGAHISTRLGRQYAFIAGDLGTAPEKGIGEPAPDTLEGVLMGLAGPVSLIPSQELTAALPEQLATRTEVPPQAGYFPLKGQYLPLTDGVLFVKNAAT